MMINQKKNAMEEIFSNDGAQNPHKTMFMLYTGNRKIKVTKMKKKLLLPSLIYR